MRSARSGRARRNFSVISLRSARSALRAAVRGLTGGWALVLEIVVSSVRESSMGMVLDAVRAETDGVF